MMLLTFQTISTIKTIETILTQKCPCASVGVRGYFDWLQIPISNFRLPPSAFRLPSGA
jgi:hypothetical protein